MSLFRFNSPTTRRRLTPAIFTGVMLVFILVLGWLGWMLVQQDAELDVQRRREQLDIDASQAVSQLDRSYRVALESLRNLHGDDLQSVVPSGVTVRMENQDIEVFPDTALRYRHFVGDGIRYEVLQRAERLEFKQRHLSAARRVLLPLDDSPEKTLRAGAWLRLARLAHKQGHPESAMDYYDKMAALSNVLTDGVPARWLGIYGRCSLLEKVNGAGELGKCGSRLLEALTSGKEDAAKSTYAFYARAVREWVAGDRDVRPRTDITDTHVVSEAVLELAELYDDIVGGRLPKEGIRTHRVDTSAVIVKLHVLRLQIRR